MRGWRSRELGARRPRRSAFQSPRSFSRTSPSPRLTVMSPATRIVAALRPETLRAGAFDVVERERAHESGVPLVGPREGVACRRRGAACATREATFVGCRLLALELLEVEPSSRAPSPRVEARPAEASASEGRRLGEVALEDRERDGRLLLVPAPAPKCWRRATGAPSANASASSSPAPSSICAVSAASPAWPARRGSAAPGV